MYKFNKDNIVIRGRREDKRKDGGGGDGLPKIIPKNPPPLPSPLLPVLDPAPPSLKPGKVMLLPLSLHQPTNQKKKGLSYYF